MMLNWDGSSLNVIVDLDLRTALQSRSTSIAISCIRAGPIADAAGDSVCADKFDFLSSVIVPFSSAQTYRCYEPSALMLSLFSGAPRPSANRSIAFPPRRHLRPLRSDNDHCWAAAGALRVLETQEAYSA
jgi:hypothetical protein